MLCCAGVASCRALQAVGSICGVAALAFTYLGNQDIYNFCSVRNFDSPCKEFPLERYGYFYAAAVLYVGLFRAVFKVSAYTDCQLFASRCSIAHSSSSLLFFMNAVRETSCRSTSVDCLGSWQPRAHRYGFMDCCFQSSAAAICAKSFNSTGNAADAWALYRKCCALQACTLHRREGST